MYCHKCGFTILNNIECPHCGVYPDVAKQNNLIGMRAVIFVSAFLGVMSAFALRLYTQKKIDINYSNVSLNNSAKAQNKPKEKLRKPGTINDGIKFFEHRDFDRAEEVFLNALKKNQYDAVSLEYLGDLYGIQGDYKRSHDYLLKTLALLPSSKRVERKLQKLKKETSLHSSLLEERRSHFNLKFKASNNPRLGEKIIEMLDTLSIKVFRDLNTELKGDVEVILLPRKDYNAITESRAWSAGIYDGKIRIPVKNVEQNLDKLRPLLLHELTHLAVNTLVGSNCPAWLNEGLARYQEGRLKSSIAFTRKYLATNPKLLLARLSKSFVNMNLKDARAAYAVSTSIVGYLIEKYGFSSIQDLLNALQDGMTAEEAIMDIYMLDMEKELVADFRQWVFAGATG